MADGIKKEELQEDKKEVLFCMPKNILKKIEKYI